MLAHKNTGTTHTHALTFNWIYLKVLVRGILYQKRWYQVETKLQGSRLLIWVLPYIHNCVLTGERCLRVYESVCVSEWEWSNFVCLLSVKFVKNLQYQHLEEFSFLCYFWLFSKQKRPHPITAKTSEAAAAQKYQWKVQWSVGRSVDCSPSIRIQVDVCVCGFWVHLQDIVSE